MTTEHLRSTSDDYFAGQTRYPACWYAGRMVDGRGLLVAELQGRAATTPPVFTNDLASPSLCPDCRAIASTAVHDHRCSDECMASEEHIRAMGLDADRQLAEMESDVDSGDRPCW